MSSKHDYTAKLESLLKEVSAGITKIEVLSKEKPFADAHIKFVNDTMKSFSGRLKKTLSEKPKDDGIKLPTLDDEDELDNDTSKKSSEPKSSEPPKPDSKPQSEDKAPSSSPASAPSQF